MGAFRCKLFSSSRRFFCFHANPSPAMGKREDCKGWKVIKPPVPVTNRINSSWNKGERSTNKTHVPQDTLDKSNRLENTELLIRRIVGSNKDLVKVSSAVINCGPGQVRSIWLSKKHSRFPLLPLLQVPHFSTATHCRLMAEAEAALGSAVLLLSPLPPEL